MLYSFVIRGQIDSGIIDRVTCEQIDREGKFLVLRHKYLKDTGNCKVQRGVLTETNETQPLYSNTRALY